MQAVSYAVGSAENLNEITGSLQTVHNTCIWYGYSGIFMLTIMIYEIRASQRRQTLMHMAHCKRIPLNHQFLSFLHHCKSEKESYLNYFSQRVRSLKILKLHIKALFPVISL